MSSNSLTGACLENATVEDATVVQSPHENEESDVPSATTATNIKLQPDCPICLLSCEFPTILPCGHIFCFLCVKGVAFKNRRCAMCRREIPAEFLARPQLVNGAEDINAIKATEDGYQWFYEGRNGWWQYDDRTTQDIEEAYKKNDKTCTILVAGYVYIVDLEALVQQRQNEPSRCRRVKRDLATITKKGVAGLRIEDNVVRNDDSRTNQQQPQIPLNRGGSARDSLDLDNMDILADVFALHNRADGALRIATDIVGSILNQEDGALDAGGAEDTTRARRIGENQRLSSSSSLSPLSAATYVSNNSPVRLGSSPPTTVVDGDSLALPTRYSPDEVLMVNLRNWNLRETNESSGAEGTTLESSLPPQQDPSNM